MLRLKKNALSSFLVFHSAFTEKVIHSPVLLPKCLSSVPFFGLFCFMPGKSKKEGTWDCEYWQDDHYLSCCYGISFDTFMAVQVGLS